MYMYNIMYIMNMLCEHMDFNIPIINDFVQALEQLSDLVVKDFQCKICLLRS